MESTFVGIERYRALGNIFELENIKYVISVDDCFAACHTDEMRTGLSVDASFSPDKVITYLDRIGKDVKNIREIYEVGGDPKSEIYGLINSLSDDEIRKYNSDEMQYNSENDFDNDKNGILNFLNYLKSNGIIDRYITFSSTQEAAKFDAKKENMTDGAILWLIDRNFENVGESSEAGMLFAKNKISSCENNFFFILTTFNTNSEDERATEEEFDNVLSRMEVENSSLVYYVGKDKLLKEKYDRVAKNLAYGFNRRLYFQIIGEYLDCLKQGCSQTDLKLQRIRKNVLSHVFSQKVEPNGESYFDFFSRLIKIYLDDSYSDFLSKKCLKISESIKKFRDMLNIIKPCISPNEIIDDLIEMRALELYDTHINVRHSEITTGDIFKIKGKYYVLATQPCDTFLRPKGERKLEKNAILLKIDDATKNGTPFKQELSCLNDSEIMLEKQAILFQEYIFIPFEILDLCVANNDGKACIKISDLFSECKLDVRFTPNYMSRYNNVKETLSKVYQQMQLVKSFFDAPCISEKGNCFDEVREAYNYIETVDNALKEYKIYDDVLVYDVQRISRLSELYTISMLNGYSGALSRVGKPFDFM